MRSGWQIISFAPCGRSRQRRGVKLLDPVLCEFRARLLKGKHEEVLFTTLLTRLRAEGFLARHGKQRTDSTHVLAAITMLNRLECIGETLRQALNVLATVVPDWLGAWLPAGWSERYAHRFEEYRLPAKKDERYALASLIGADGLQLLAHIDQQTEWMWLRELPALVILRAVWGIEARIAEFEGTGILPIDPPSHGIGGLPI